MKDQQLRSTVKILLMNLVLLLDVLKYQPNIDTVMLEAIREDVSNLIAELKED